MRSVSRRSVLVPMVLSAAGVAHVLTKPAGAANAPMLPQKSVAYRPTPDGDRKCDNCKLFIKPDACEKVQGKVSPDGYCILYQKA